ncbi:MAG: GGDEF domain-containing protein [Patescibacteria group bacterium]|jgi:diguanylate cyclase (GGDEF)-like protein
MPTGDVPTFNPEEERGEEGRTFTRPGIEEVPTTEELEDGGKGVEAREARRIYVDLMERRFGPAIAKKGVPEDVFREQLESLKEQAREMAQERINGEKDELTGLWRKETFARLFDVEIEHMDNYKPGEVLVLLAVDLDKFKKTNDILGHDAADLKVGEFGEVSMSKRRKTDFGGRMGGGDEFCFALTRVKEGDIDKVMNRFMDSVRSIDLGHDLGNLTASIGVKIIHKEDSKMPFVDERKDADFAAYMAKRNGRNRWIRTDSEEMKEKEKGEDWFLMNLREDNARKLDRYAAYPDLLANFEETLKIQARLDYQLYLNENLAKKET